MAEIGVARGDFSATIMSLTKPAKLHLIDAWIHQERADLTQDSNNPPQLDQDQRHQGVLGRFAAEIASGQVEVHRSLSHLKAASFPDRYFDWIYVDADHSYDGVTGDLEAYFPKIKPDGLILGHDYSWHGKVNFGVVEAVNDFISRHRLDFLAINTGDTFPSYVLARRGSSLGHKFLGKATFSIPCVVELRDYPNGYKFSQRTVSADGRRRGFLSFGPTAGADGYVSPQGSASS
ncbi:MAG: class I SAM-dependent methyltransferase [Alphaproteobacteria bacterium]|nr:class I SAM-dependent methyltransferase [Alphaproteobacteria bacterium]